MILSVKHSHIHTHVVTNDKMTKLVLSLEHNTPACQNVFVYKKLDEVRVKHFYVFPAQELADD